jgi:hypothetical protein
MMRTESRWAVIAAFALVYLVWGSTYLAVALAVHSIPPLLLMGGRSVVGGTALFVGARLAGSPSVSIADWGGATVCGILFFRDLSWVFGLRPAARSERPVRHSSGDNSVLDCVTQHRNVVLFSGGGNHVDFGGLRVGAEGIRTDGHRECGEISSYFAISPLAGQCPQLV